MSDEAKTEDGSAEPGTPSAPRGRKRRWLGGILAVLAVVLLLLAGGAWSMLGRPISAPDWVRVRIEQRLAEAVPALDISFGDMRLLVDPDGLAHVALTDVDIRSDTGAQVATLSDIEAGFSPSALLRGEVVLRRARLTGAMLALRRDAHGKLGLALGDVFDSDAPMPDLPTLIGLIDGAFARPQLAGLRSVEAEALTIRYEDVRAGRGWTADGGRLSLTREDGALRLAGDVALLGRGDTAATLELNAESRIGETSADFGMALEGLDAQDIATQSPALAWLHGLRAPISGALRGSMTEDGQLGALNATLRIGAGVLQPNTRTQPIPFDLARTYFSYSPGSATLTFDEISVRSAVGTILADGRAILREASDGWPRSMTGQFRVSRFEADPEGFLDRPLALDGAEVDWQLDFEPFRFELGRLRVSDPSLPLRLSGMLAADPEGWRLAVDGQLARIDKDGLLAYWPERIAPKQRKWVVDNIHAGEIRDGILSLRLAPGGTLEPYIDARVQDVSLTYARHLPRLVDADGQMTIYDHRFAVAVDRGRAVPPEGGSLDATGTTFVIPDMRERPARGEVSLRASGPLVAALSYLDSPKLEVMQKANKPVALGEGAVSVEGRIELPLKKGVQREEMTVTATGTVQGFSSTEVVPGRTLSADRLALDLDDDRLVISGTADMSGIPFDGRWEQSLIPGEGSRVEGQVALSQPVVEALGVTLADGTISGRGTGALSIALDKGAPPRFSLTSSLAGVGLSLPQIGWRLSQRQTGRFEISGSLGKPVTVDRLALSGNGLDTSGTVTLDANGKFSRLELPRLKVGGWLDGAAVLSARGQGRAPAVALSGALLDMRRAPFGTGGGGAGGGGPISVRMDRLQVSDTIWVSDFAGDFSTAGGINGDFTGDVGGTAPVGGTLVPQNGSTAVRIRSRDAGDVLEGAGIFRNVQDGTFDLTLIPVRGAPGSYDGALAINGARLQDAPAITGLLDAVSIVGLIDELNGPGIFFSEVEARFRLTPTQVILRRSSAVGPSMGISLDGYFNLRDKTMDMQGVLSPVYILNGIGRLFSRKGEGLIGFNFNLAGPVADPGVSVNPLSVFTPGMFRDIFRRPPPTVSQ
ncbi:MULTISPECIES: YhdP family protein [Salipiger]|uniref:AsmA-like C-terminal region n=1 Tax=Salipiger profundus TaxID=1229727 RepID=A0A1U7DBI3_9RHOB|nr:MULTISPECIES: DUF3971 domain-containing protein [Salipiger]APX25537.1 AsmA-like C-terminal region [Salipiger profundus]GGA04783.1 hypothetical protein GCM10011326_15840 [Salipiger profundus]SFD70153.1 AsmA-like C-terminal region [Salipiger profundus]